MVGGSTLPPQERYEHLPLLDENSPNRRQADYTSSMTQSREILEAALKLDPVERAAIASNVIDRLAGSAHGQLSPAWEDEIQRRLRNAKAGQAKFMSAERVFADLDAELRAGRAPR